MRRSREWWSSTVAEWRNSGLTQVAFARDAGINVNTLRWWIAEFRHAEPAHLVEVVELEPARSDVRLELELPSGATLRFDELPSASWLAEFVAAC